MKSTVLTSLVASIVLSATAQAQSPSPWHTSGSTILDANQQSVRIAGVNWYGFETTDETVHGLWAQDYKSILNTIKANGYNVIRLPFSNQMVESPIVPSNISFTNSGGAINSDLKGLNSLQILDQIVAYCGQIGLHVILDNHRSEAGNSAESNGLWYTSAYPESAWINDWTTLANRYRSSPAVVGADLRNEPHNATSGGACWGCGSSTNDWSLAAARAGNAVLSANPNWLIFVEGTDCYNGDCDWWGGNLEGAQTHPVILSTSNRLVYSAHDYGPTEYGQSWFNSATTPSSLAAVWTKFWAYLSINGIAPVWLGEFGTTNNNADIQNATAGSEGQWFQSLIAFLHTNSSISWTYWALNGEDRYGLLDSNYDAAPANALKQQALASIEGSPSGGPPTCQAAPSTPAQVSATATSASQINVTWASVPAPSGCTVTYSVYEGETPAFTPGPANQVATALTAPAYTASNLSAATTYYFVISAMDAAGSSADSSAASATTSASAGQTPAAPATLSATAVSSSQIALTWSASSTTGVSYNVYRSLTSGFAPSTSTLIASGVSGTSTTSSGLAASTAYYFLVTASNSNGQSSPSPQATATTQSTSPSSSCHVVYTVNSQWNNGFNVSITLQNTGTTTLNSWTLTWAWPSSQMITQAWNSNLVQGGPSVVLTNASWNGTVAPGAVINGIGFNASYSGSNPAPASFSVNGTPCR